MGLENKLLAQTNPRNTMSATAQNLSDKNVSLEKQETRDMYAEPSADFRKKNVRAHRCCRRRRPSRAR